MSKHTIDKEEQHWFDVLAGKAAPNDQNTQQVAKLRQILIAQREQDRQQTPDPQAEKRLLNLLQARRASEGGAKSASLPSRIWQWIFPPSGAHLGRSGGMVAIALALVSASLLLIQQQQIPISDQPTTKGISKNAASVPPEASIPEGEYSSTTPEADSARLLKILTDARVAASRQQEGETWLIKAQIDLAKLDEINAKLTTQFGIATPASGTLLVRFKKLQ